MVGPLSSRLKEQEVYIQDGYLLLSVTPFKDYVNSDFMNILRRPILTSLVKNLPTSTAPRCT